MLKIVAMVKFRQDKPYEECRTFADHSALLGPDNKPATMESGDSERLVDELALIGSADQVQEKLELFRAGPALSLEGR